MTAGNGPWNIPFLDRRHGARVCPAFYDIHELYSVRHECVSSALSPCGIKKVILRFCSYSWTQLSLQHSHAVVEYISRRIFEKNQISPDIKYLVANVTLIDFLFHILVLNRVCFTHSNITWECMVVWT